MSCNKRMLVNSVAVTVLGVMNAIPGEAGAALRKGGPTDPIAYERGLAEAGSQSVQAGVGLSNLSLSGAHHRSLLDDGLVQSAKGSCVWTTVDAARQNKTNTDMALAEAGACQDIGNTRIGAGVGYASARQDWALGGSAKFTSQYFIAEAATRIGNSYEASLLGYYGKVSTELNRNYQNGAAVDTSSAQPDADAIALRARLDWKNAATLGRFSLSPYAIYSWMKTSLDAYTETGGGFPATYAAATWRSSDLRLGAAGKAVLSESTDLRIGLEAAHRFDDSTNGVSGTANSLPFNLQGADIDQTWARVTVDADHRFSSSTVLSVGANAASSGGDPSWGVTAGIRTRF